jgi:hypothetical protein
VDTAQNVTIPFFSVNYFNVIYKPLCPIVSLLFLILIRITEC